MQILLAPAKLMIDDPQLCPIDGRHTPIFQTEADKIAACMCGYDIPELIDILHINREIAISTHQRYNDFFEPSTRRAAIARYDGIVFKNIDAETLTSDQLEFVDKHINICSFLYGILRPLDAINPYRMEGSVVLPVTGGISMFDYWKSRLTDLLITRTKDDDGILVNLASNEMQKLFDWKRVKRELNVISPEFKVETPGRLKTITVYSKICRGAMTRFIVSNLISNPSDLTAFQHQGFTYTSGPLTAPLFTINI